MSTKETATAAPSDWVDPNAQADLKQLVAFPTVSDNPDAKQRQAVADLLEMVMTLFKATGPATLEVRRISDDSSSNPILYGTWKAATPKAPTVLLYGHYDVVRADEDWLEPDGKSRSPFEPFEWKGRLYGRGSADDKSGIIMHLSTLRALQGRLPVNVTLVLEGEEEIGGHLDGHIQNNPDLFQADVIVIADTGNVAEGKPTLTTSLRGLVSADVTVSTLDHAEHSGMFGGPALDAFMVLTRMINSLVDWRGDVAVAGLNRYTDGQWAPSSPDEEALFRSQAGVLNGVQLAESGSITQRIAGSPSVVVVGLDGIPSTANSVNQLHPSVTARISVRIAPDQDPNQAYQALRTHLINAAPFGVTPTINPGSSGDGYHIRGNGGRFFDTACRAAKDAYPDAQTCVRSGLGGTIPMINVIAGVQRRADATVVMWGCEEPVCRIHGTVESVSYKELECMTRAEVNLLNYVAAVP
jgi:acetylornithine deacetylase/succinyl-diaminopimelate desuccinylase-like protein